jgi:hypothetical protein
MSFKNLMFDSLTLSLFEWGSVHTNPASINLTLFNPFNFFKQRARSSRDSRAHCTHSAGGWKYLGKISQISKVKVNHENLIVFLKYLSHPLQKCSVACFGIPSVMSIWDLRHATHMFAGFGSIVTPHSQHKLKNRTNSNKTLLGTHHVSHAHFPFYIVLKLT